MPLANQALSGARRRRPLRAALAAVGAAALVAAGCGGGEDGDFREQAEAICAEYDDRIDAVVTPQSITQLAETSGAIADLLDEQLVQLRELDPPRDAADRYDEWLRLNEEAVANAREIQAAAEAGDERRIQVLAGAAERNELEADRIARDLEIPRCMIEERELDRTPDDGVATVETNGDE